MKKESTKAAGQTNTLKPAERMPYSRGKYIDEANEFLEQCMGGNAYKEALHQGLEGQDTYPYVVARLHLGPDDWNKYVWIENNGSLAGFPEQPGYEKRRKEL